MSIKKVVLMFIALMVFTCTVAAQDQTQNTQKVIKNVPIQSTSPVSGKDMYTAYCAVCHGTDGKGGGPAASALKTPPSDLTLLSKNNGGKYRRRKSRQPFMAKVDYRRMDRKRCRSGEPCFQL